MVEINIAANYVPSPGTTIPGSGSVIHDIIDQATVTAEGSVENNGPFDVVSNYSLAYRESIQFKEYSGIKVGHVTDMSLSPVLYDNLLAKGGVGYFEPASAPSVANVIQKGMPAFMYPNAGPGAMLLGKKDRLTGKNSPGAATSSLDGDDRYRHVFPVINGDLKAVGQTAMTLTSQGKNFVSKITPFAIAGQAVTTATLQPMELIFKGPAEALLHASMSSSFQSNDLYCLRFDGNSPTLQYPVSWNGSAAGMYIPWGVVRNVYTDSGVTNIVNHRITNSYSLAAQPYYVADVWFWGEPCL